MLILSCIKTLRGYLRGAEFLRIEKKNHIENLFVHFKTHAYVLLNHFATRFFPNTQYSRLEFAIVCHAAALHTHTYSAGTSSYWFSSSSHNTDVVKIACFRVRIAVGLAAVSLSRREWIEPASIVDLCACGCEFRN